MNARPSVRVRPFRETDRAFVQSLMPRLVPERSASPRDPGAIARFLAEHASGERSFPPGTEHYIAETEAGKPVGLLAIRPDQDYFGGHPRAYVELLAVTEAATGQGVGRALMDHADSWAAAHGCREIVLDVFAGNEGAIAFYHRIGFEPDHLRLTRPVAPDSGGTSAGTDVPAKEGAPV